MLLSRIFTSRFANLYDLTVWGSRMKYGVARTPASQVTGRPFILPSHLSIESSPAATASRCEPLPRFKVGPGRFSYEMAAIDGNPADYNVRRRSLEAGGACTLLQFICVRLQPLGFDSNLARCWFSMGEGSFFFIAVFKWEPRRSQIRTSKRFAVSAETFYIKF